MTTVLLTLNCGTYYRHLNCDNATGRIVALRDAIRRGFEVLACRTIPTTMPRTMPLDNDLGHGVKATDLLVWHG